MFYFCLRRNNISIRQKPPGTAIREVFMAVLHICQNCYSKKEMNRVSLLLSASSFLLSVRRQMCVLEKTPLSDFMLKYMVLKLIMISNLAFGKTITGMVTGPFL